LDDKLPNKSSKRKKGSRREVHSQTLGERGGTSLKGQKGRREEVSVVTERIGFRTGKYPRKGNWQR